MKSDISNGLVDIKKKLQELLKLNQSREDLAKLKEHEFYLDTEELERLQKESDSEMLKVCDTFFRIAEVTKVVQKKFPLTWSRELATKLILTFFEKPFSY